MRRPLLCRLGLHKFYMQVPGLWYCLRDGCGWEYYDMEQLDEYSRLKHAVPLAGVTQ